MSEALRGPWLAVIAWRDGEVCTWDEFVAGSDDPEDVRISIARGTAAPVDRDGSRRLPGTYNRADLLVEFDGEDFESINELNERWGQAQAMAAGLNAATKED